jgi:AcrR family transcriptional regulator
MVRPRTRTAAKSARKPRRVGRPGGDHANHRERLIDAAIALFTLVGIRGTSLRAIAKAAGVTPAMLHYYFGDKTQLQQAMVDERLMPALAPMRERVIHVGDDPAVAVEVFVNGIGEVVTQHPWLPALWVREVLCEGGELREILFARLLSKLPRELAQRFATAKARGRINPALDPRLLVVSLVGLTLFPLAGAPIWRRVFAADDIDSQTLLRHTLALLRDGMRLHSTGVRA